jgi:hypothetical protein
VAKGGHGAEAGHNYPPRGEEASMSKSVDQPKSKKASRQAFPQRESGGTP